MSGITVIPKSVGSGAPAEGTVITTGGAGTVAQVLTKWSDGSVRYTDPPEYNVKAWGAVGNDEADDYKAFREAWEAATAAATAGPGGFVVRIPKGAYRLNRSFEGGAPNLTIPPNMIGKIILKGSGRGVTIVRLSANVVALLNSGTPGARETIRNVTVEDLTVDAKNVASANSGIVFNVSASGINVDSLHCKRVDVINGGTAGSARRNISINVTRNDPFGVAISTTLSEALEATGVTVIPFTSEPKGLNAGMQFTIGTGGEEETLTVSSSSGKNVTVKAPGTTKTHVNGAAIKLLAQAENTVTNILVEDCDFGWGQAGESTGGGGTGVYIGAFCTPSQSEIDNAYYNATNPAALVLFDQIVCRRVRWRTNVDPSGFAACSGIQVGGDGYCKKVDIDDCSMRGSGDVGYEIDSCLDLTMTRCYAENCWNENFFVANNHGGMAWPSRQTSRFIDCTSVISASNLLTAPYGAYSRHGTSFGEFLFQNCVYKHTAPRFLNGAGTTEANPSNGAFRLTGKWRRASFLKCSAIYDGLALEATANNVTTTPIGILIQQMGGTATVDIQDFSMELNGTAKQGAFTGCVVQADCVKIDYAANLYLTINGIRPRTNLQMLDTSQFRMRELNLNTAVGTMTESWAVANSLTRQYIVDSGEVADLKQEATFLASVAHQTTRKLLRIWNGLYINNQPADQIGKVMDASLYVQAEVATGAVGGTELISRLRVNDAGNTEIRARLVDEGGETKLLIEKVTEGTPTVLATEKLTRITVGEKIGVRLKQQGNILTADYFSAPGAAPAYNTAGTTTLTYTLAAGAERNTWGALGVPGYIGWGWTPGEATAKFNLTRYDHLSVISGTVDRLTPLGNEQGANVTNGIVFNANSTLLRFRGKLRCRNWQREAVKKDTPVDIGSPDSTQKAEIEVAASTLAEPVAPAAISVTASPFTYTNIDMVQEDVETIGGTVSALELSRDGGVTFSSLSSVAVTLVIRLMPGDQLKTTYAIAPTMKKIPAY